MSVSGVSMEDEKNKDTITILNKDSARFHGKNADSVKAEKKVRHRHRLIDFILITLSIMLMRIAIILLLLYMLG